MNVDDIVKLMLATGFTFSLVGISIQIMRLIGKLASSIQDLRKTFQNVSKVSDLAVEDYQRGRVIVFKILDLVDNFQENILSPLKSVTNLLSLFRQKRSGGDDDGSAV